MKFQVIEYNAIFAGLRLLQRAIIADNIPRDILDVFTDGDTSPTLTAGEIDKLCDKINGEN